MIFTAEETRLILTGRKTQTRRRTSAHARHHAGRVYQLERYGRGDEITPEQRAKNTRVPITIAHFQAIDVRKQRVGDITQVEAIAEGFKTTDEFRDAWTRKHSLESFAKHADLIVTVLTIQIVETPRLLRASMIRGAGITDYVDTPADAAQGEPEAITADQLAELTRYNAARVDQERRKPIATHADAIRRELEAISERMAEAGLVDRDVKRTIRQMAHSAQRLKEKLDA